MDETAELPEEYRQLAQATANTHRCIALLATAREVRWACQRDRECSAERMSKATTRYRELEAQLEDHILAEMDAHINVLDYELMKKEEEGASADPDQPTDDS